ncbi:MAG: glycogen debranching enzyme GlgX [Deltaproteobacteria bacterium]|nr:MAG: glycogen debranching enzyme GlgX [Deltaproteobacteria bacterium]
MDVWPGRPNPLGATYDGSGTNFALFSEAAERVELSLFDDGGQETRITLPEQTGLTHHGYVPGIRPGQCYGFRVHGPYDPGAGHRCLSEKLLVDPYAKAIEGGVDWNPAVYGHALGDPDGPANRDDSAPYVPRSVVINPYFDWGHDRAPRTPWHDTIIYELHIKGFTHTHPQIPEHLRGTYAGLAHPVAVDHLKKLGVTAVELMPVHHFVHDQFLEDAGKRNYWGYNTLGYFAPHDEYASAGSRGEQVQEFKQLVKTLHREGIEVILDVVYNHTCEGNHCGPTLSFRGIDNKAYYRVDSHNPRRYVDYTGTGNTMNMRHPHVLQLIMDSLRYWILEMHVDGFRFDLASTLARELHAVDRLAVFFQIIQQDPVINQAKLIAEPWDVGEGGYQVGNFPPLWSEWNGKYRDSVRDFWRGEDQKLGEFAARLTGSSDLYAMHGRRPHASVNFVTAHDGFTLRDLVSYNHKHNDDNCENNRDGESHNRSWNCGEEGETDDPDVLALRTRQQCNFLATLFLSQGVPMLLAGDELGRSQRGNNNTYCQDNELSWIDWERQDVVLLEFVRRLIALRRAHPIFRRRRFFLGQDIRGGRDIAWFTPDGAEMTAADWNLSFARAVGIYLDGGAIQSTDRRGEPLVDDSFFMIFNAHDGPLEFVLPHVRDGGSWEVYVCTERDLPVGGLAFRSGERIDVGARSVWVFCAARGVHFETIPGHVIATS